MPRRFDRRADTLHARPLRARTSFKMGVVSKVAACVPIYDFLTAQTYAMWMLHLQVIVCAFGALSFAFTGVLQITFGFTILALVSLEVGSMKLAKVRSRAIVPDASSRRVDARRDRATSVVGCHN